MYSRIATLCLFALLTANVSFSQTGPAAETAAGATESSSAADLHILYTGKMMGYFRVPDWQPMDDRGCSPTQMGARSAPAGDFNKLVASLPGSILVATGDNFAPEIEGRVFCLPPNVEPNGSRYRRVGKELFFWDTSSHRWVAFDDEGRKKPERDKKDCAAVLDDDCGTGLIPFDNVANFFIQSGYAALVPGKHDFFFGPERLRQLARYLASTDIPAANPMLHGRSVQMLGANLVIDTTWRNGHSPLPDKELPPWFIPRFPSAADIMPTVNPRDEARLEIRLAGLNDGGNVYPWFQGPTLQVSKNLQAPELIAQLRNSLYLCESGSDPNAIPKPLPITQGSPCHPVSLEPAANDAQEYKIYFWKQAQTLTPGRNYGLCAAIPAPSGSKQDAGRTFCLRFSVYRPFFQHPWGHGAESCPRPYPAGNCFRDPDPYVLLESSDHPGLTKDVAIFGILDPALGEHIGMLNFSWANANDDYKTRAAIKEPSEALQEMVSYFERRYREKYGRPFEGIKMLLAQMTPQQTQLLILRLPGFQVAVSAADEEMAMVNDHLSLTWKPSREGANSAGRHPRLLGVPSPFFTRKVAPRWAVDIGSLSINFLPQPALAWEIQSNHLQKESQVGSAKIEAPNFWQAVQSKLQGSCLPSRMEVRGDPLSRERRTENIRVLALCAMQHYTGADVALLQQRDFFVDLPRLSGDVDDPELKQRDPSLQQILDRVVWKGDLLTLLYVPGSAIKAAMDHSREFEAEDRSKLSLPAEKERGLVYLGVTFDSERREYIINGMPLDSSKLYAVATSDYIGAGDTGYPYLAAAQLKPPVSPTDFDGRLNTIASVVCRELAGHNAPADCLEPLARDDYFDRLAGVAPNDLRPGNTPARDLWRWSIFHHASAVPGEVVRNESVTDAAQRTVEQRPIWDFNLQKWSIGVTTVGHNDSDFDIQNNFSGITTPGVNAFRSTTIATDFLAQWSRSWGHGQFFIAPSYTYNVQDRGQPDNLRVINQVADIGALDVGYVYRVGGRSAEELDGVFSHHFETPLTQAFNAFTLSSTHLGAHGETVPDQIRFELDRSYTELVRPGLRWKKRASSLEFGPQWGHEWNALREIDFTTGKFFTACPTSAALPISQCVKAAVKANPKSITPASVVSTRRDGQDHAGMYWKLNLTVPFHPRVAYVLTDNGDWFFVHYATETSTTTLLRDVSQHQLRFTIFPSFSIGPELDLLLYENKTVGALRGHFLRQNQLIMKAQFNFDWFNRRNVAKQIEYAPPRSAPK